ncbi:aminotransferase class V-fold PLP-dependent enzyme [Leptospira ellisii]|uniref:Aminotransferase n=1 Tax=Leptospira ellisii TaxID=2023197 RepID=A0A2N0BD28_9LEPT|nr:aminotransferase class V-fold PLP-dependent enzyme [Leptospira ellisii]MDV6237358.1 aminotransferase class V-fold PLP-dependent enzyme [Leptospira ellisii]PJZ94443.1 aminotransferase [Leptospira ellisii]PKA04555.1 aminotransferase [Leptospira ellisii]
MLSTTITDWKEIQDLYPINEEMIWLNNCGTTPCNVNTIRSVQEYMEGYSRRGGLTEVRRYPTVKHAIRKIIAGLINCNVEELSLIHHTNEGMNFISLGFQLKSGDEILLLENEYPSNVYPWEHWKEKGVSLGFIPMASTPDEFLENLKRAVTPKTKVVALSAVHWCTGMPFPLEEIGNFLDEQGIEFVLDGAQGVGLIPIDVRKMKLKYVAFPAWKWLLGPLGLGVLYIQQDRLDRLAFPFKGTSSVVNDEVYLPYRGELKTGADRYEISTVNFIDWVYFQSTLEMLSKIGFHSAMERIYELADYLGEGMKNVGFQLEMDHFPDNKTGIVVGAKEGIPMDELVSYLKKNGVMCALRLGKVRFSPHIYNRKDQLDRVVQLIGTFPG